MKPTDRARLTTALRDHVAKIAVDLRAKIRAAGSAARAAAEQLHKDERVAEDFEVWTDLLSRRAAVLWVLKSVYVRVLEDRGLLQPGRLLDPEAQQLFEKLAPNLGETAFLRWIYRDLASSRGGVPELFSPQPAEVALPSDELSRALIAFWRHRDADTGAVWSFAEEKFEGELMGDLYQELDPVVKDRFALCQTPDFVRAFILDRTLTPAAETFGADEVRLLDPACGSGHFLIDGLKRLVAATAEKHPDWEKDKVVAHALERVVGIDLNDYACALARTRLIMTAAELAGVTKLADAARFHPHVYWADGLEQVEKEEQKPSLQFSLFEKVEERPRATLTRSDVRAALKKVFEKKFHAVVANPPYITEADDARRAYHKERVAGRPRYVSAYKEYHLSCPFTERAFQLCAQDGFVGLIVDNQFMRKDYGKPLIENVLSNRALTLLVDTSFAHIPFHGTPTVLIFARNQPSRPVTRSVRDDAPVRVRVVAGKKGENETPVDAAQGKVWRGIEDGWRKPGFEDEYVSVFDTPSEQLSKHPWALTGTDSSSLKEQIEKQSDRCLKAVVADAGAAVLTRADEVYVMPPGLLSARFGPGELRPFATGKGIRDWAFAEDSDVLFPYRGEEDSNAISSPQMERWLWRFRTRLWLRREPNGNHREIGLTWWEWSRFIRRRYENATQIAFSNVATHNHFSLVSRPALFGSHAPCIRFTQECRENDQLAILAILNSSVFCFWMKQVFQPKGKTSANRNHPSPERFAYELGTTQLQQFPLPKRMTQNWADRLASLARDLAVCGRRRTQTLSAASWIAAIGSANGLREALTARWAAHDLARREMIFLQEEVDWLVYFLYGLVPELLCGPPQQRRLARGQRAFEMLRGHRSFVRKKNVTLAATIAECDGDPEPLCADYQQVVAGRSKVIQDNPAISQLENYMFKRLWRDTEENITEPEFRRRHDAQQLRAWLEDQVELTASQSAKAFTTAKIAASLMGNDHVHAVAEVYTGTPGFSIEMLVTELVEDDAVPSCPWHTYTPSGLVKHEAWQETWRLQRLEDSGASTSDFPPPPDFSQGSRGKPNDFLRPGYWRLRGKLDVPTERFIAFTEVPGRSGAERYYGWAGWTAQQRVKAILAIDEELEDASVPLADRIGLLDSAWRLLPDVAREDAPAATRLKAELQALVGPEGPSAALIEDWKKRFPPPTSRAARAAKPGKRSVKRAAISSLNSIERTDEDDDVNLETDDA